VRWEDVKFIAKDEEDEEGADEDEAENAEDEDGGER